jgi:hypothetical protein
MDHSYIDKFDLVDRYLMGKLADDESAQFEEHYADCQQCAYNLLITRNFIQDLHSPAIRRSLQRDGYSRGRARSRFTHLPSAKALAIAVACLLVITATGVVLAINLIQRTRSDVKQARDEAAEWRHNYEEAQEAASRSEKKLEEREQELTEQLRSLETRLHNTEESPGHQENESSLWTQAKINLPMFSLHSVKRGEQNPAPGANEVILPKSPTGFLILAGLESYVNYKDYRVTIVDDRNLTVMKRTGFKRNPTNALSMGLNSKLFQPGKYLLTVEGITDDGGIEPVGNYPFRVIKKN